MIHAAFMNFLEHRILQEGIVKEGNILKVDSFLNHQIDMGIMKEIAKMIGADSLGFLNPEYVTYLNGSKNTNCYCTACFGGKYPTKTKDEYKAVSDYSKKLSERI